MKKYRHFSCQVLILSLALYASCAGAPASKAPAWILETPAPDARYTYFTGYASAGPGQVAEATDAATASLTAEIMRYIGVTVSAESTATAKASLNSFQSDIVQTVKQSSTSRVSGFQVSEKYVQTTTSGLTVYILGRFETKALEGERKRIAAVFQEKLDAVAKPEAEGHSLLASGNVVGAIRKFSEAALASASSTIENAEIKLERNLNAAKNAAAQLEIVKLNDQLSTAAGAPFAAPFQGRVNRAGQPLAEVPVSVAYQVKLPNGRLGTKKVTLLSQDNGAVTFNHPVPDFVGKATLVMALDLGSITEPLYTLPSKYNALVAALEDEIAQKRVTFAYSVVSQARSIPLAVQIVDTDQDGKVLAGITGSALMAGLSGHGFVVMGAQLKPELLAGHDDEAITKAAKAALGSKAQRLAYGVAKVIAIKQDQNQFIATVAADCKIVNLANGTILYAATKQVAGIGNSEQAAIEAARKQLGQKTLADDAAARLP